MKRLAYALAAIWALASAEPVRADILPLILDTPTNYTPGSSFTFEVRAPGLVGLADYTIELVFQTVGEPQLAVLAFPGLPEYPYSNTDGFDANTQLNPGVDELRLLVTDMALVGSPPNTEAGINDLLFRVIVTPDLSQSGPIIISVDPDSLRFGVNGETAPTIEIPEPITIPEYTGSDPSPVPTPAAWVHAW